MIFPTPEFVGCDFDPILDEDVDRMIRLALLWDMGFSIEEAQAWEALRGKAAS